MSIELTVPKISEDADSGTVAEIYVSEGDQIDEGQSIIAVDSDKASVDIPADQGGTVESIEVSEGDEVQTGDLILKLSETNGQVENSPDDEGSSDGESEPERGETDYDKQEASGEPEEETSEKANTNAASSPESEEEKPSSGEKPEENKKPSENQADSEDDKKTTKKKEPGLEDSPSAPLAKQFARELDLDIKEVPASGERVTREDVMAYAKKLINQGGKSSSSFSDESARGLYPLQMPDFSKFGDTERQPMSKVRSAIATNTLQSWQNIPHVTHHDKAEAQQLLEFQELQELSMTAIITKIVAEALRRFPKFNASLDLKQEEVVFKDYIHIGVAVDTDDGLLMPVLRNADQKSVHELSKELEELAQRARDRQLNPEEMQGGNFVISNLGGIGGTSFTPVIFPPQSAILGVSATQTEVVFEEGKAKPKSVLPLSLSYDHRLIDGAEAARFVRWLCTVMKQPLRLLS